MATQNYVVPLQINGKESSHSSTYDIISPSKNDVCWTAVSASAKDALSAIEAAKAAFPSWSSTKPSVRTAILLKAADIMEASIEQYAGYMMTEMGADIGAAQFFVLPLAISMCRDIAGRISSICGSVPAVAAEGQSAMVLREPYGVVLGIVPWFVLPTSPYLSHSQKDFWMLGD
jgi:acyl-CoA reductase-like NAD-dependent aldehyde dehydrogenase